MRRYIELPVALSATIGSTAAAERPQQETCKALVMSGGGSNGAWEAGVVWGLINYGGDLNAYEYDVVIGTSIGAINTLAFAVHEKGDELEAADFLVDIWEGLLTRDIWQRRSMVDMFLKPSLLDTSPGFQTLKELVEPFGGYQRSVTFSAVDINTGRIVNLTDESVPFEEAHIAAIASASYPPFFPPTPYKGMLLVDGNTAYNTNVQAAIDRCREVVDDDSKITIDVLICGSETQVHPIVMSGNAWSNYWRYSDIQTQYRNYNSLLASQRAHPKIEWRHTVNQNSHKLPDLKELTFDPQLSSRLIQLGIQDARESLGLEPLDESVSNDDEVQEMSEIDAEVDDQAEEEEENEQESSDEESS